MKTTVVQKPDAEEIPIEIIAQHIATISQAMKKIDSGRVKRRVVVLLIRDQTQLSISDIERVLNAMESLEATFLKIKPKSKAK